jgi:hypothetical protein
MINIFLHPPDSDAVHVIVYFYHLPLVQRVFRVTKL